MVERIPDGSSNADVIELQPGVADASCSTAMTSPPSSTTPHLPHPAVRRSDPARRPCRRPRRRRCDEPGGPYGRTKGAKRVVAVDVTGLPVAALVVPASTHENRASELMLEHLTRPGRIDRLEHAFCGMVGRPAPTAARPVVSSWFKDQERGHPPCDVTSGSSSAGRRRAYPPTVVPGIGEPCEELPPRSDRRLPPGHAAAGECSPVGRIHVGDVHQRN